MATTEYRGFVAQLPQNYDIMARLARAINVEGMAVTISPMSVLAYLNGWADVPFTVSDPLSDPDEES